MPRTAAPDDEFVGIGFAKDSRTIWNTNLERPWWTDEAVDGEPWLPMAPGKLLARDMEFTGKAKLRSGRSLERICVLYDSSDQLVLRADIANEVFSGLPPTELQLHPVELSDAKGLLGTNWRHVDIRTRHPLDRDTAKVTYYDNAPPHFGMPRRVLRIAWSMERAPGSSITRVGELPTIMCARRTIVARLTDLTEGAIVEVLTKYAKPKLAEEVIMDGFLRYYDQEPPRLPNAPSAKAAASAFWSAYDGRKIDRAAVMKSPHYAFWLAALIDKRPAPDTRAAACLHPYYAAAYARDIDGKPREDTRRAACGHPYAAANYVRDVDGREHPETKRAVEDAETYEEALSVANAIKAWRKKPGGRGTVTTRRKR